MRTRHGFTLIELLLALVVMVTVLGGALSFLVSQSRMFRRGGDAMGVLQNLSFGADNLHSQLRTAGANTADDQPPVIYAGPNTFAFNADYVSNDKSDFGAVYIDPDAPSDQVDGMLAARQIEVPNSAPAFMYPVVDYPNDAGINTPAETIILYFALDGETARGDDFLLMRQVNDQPPEVLIRRVLRDSINLPFFRYYKMRTPPGNGQVPVLSLMPADELPVSHTVPTHGTAADAASRIDSLRAVLVSYVVTNGESGAQERQERISFNIPLPNMGLRQLKICGSEPIHGSGLVAAFDNADGTDKVNLSWNRAFDESLGEKDVVRYVLWRRKTGEPWADPFTSVNAAGLAAYLYIDSNDLEKGVTYEYRLAAQDCTPKLSAPVAALPVAVPAF